MSIKHALIKAGLFGRIEEVLKVYEELGRGWRVPHRRPEDLG